ncbi:MAG: molybdopterin molybdotransferase MoeA [Pseudomonadota bacterium]
MIPLAEAQTRLIALAKPVSSETVPLLGSIGRWLAADVIAQRTQPARDLSAMDGYAVNAADEQRSWRVIGESAAGKPSMAQIGTGEAVRIFTGAALPPGDNMIIIQENVTRDNDVIALLEGNPPEKGRHVRPLGGDFVRGEMLFPAGTRLSPAGIALAAMGGHGSVPVRRPVRIAIISSGDELVAPGTPTDDDHIPATNALMIASMLDGWPVKINDIGIVADTLDALIIAVKKAANADIIITSGGASVGDHDLVRPALIAAGATLDFWKVAMRPGKPLMAGQLGDSIVLGLPGNPVSAFVTAVLFLKPAIAALSGAAEALPRSLTGILGAEMPAVGARTDHIRARLSENRLFPVGIDDSAALKGLARADALIVREAGAKPANIGDLVQFIPLT